MYRLLVFKTPITLGALPGANKLSYWTPDKGELEMTDFGVTITIKGGVKVDVFKENIASATQDPAARQESEPEGTQPYTPLSLTKRPVGKGKNQE